jgi:hypothetical protein
MKKETRQIVGKQHFRATFDKNSINVDKRTVDVVFATERAVMMYNWNIGLFNEVLICDESAGDLSRLNNGAPLLDTHRKGSVKTDGLGVVERAWFDNGVGRATVRFSKRVDVETVWQDVQDGIVTGVSVGYDVYQYETTEEVGKLPLYRATKWAASEISLALVQADQDSAVGRSSDDNSKHEVEIISKNFKPNKMKRSEILQLVRAAGLSMEFAQTLIDDESITTEQVRSKIEAEKAKTNPPAPASNEPAPTAETIEQLRTKYQKDGNKRASEIINSVRAAGLDVAFAQELIDDEKVDLAAARAKIIEKMASGGTQEKPTHTANAGVQVGADETDKFRDAVSTGIALRSAQVQEKDFKPEAVSAAREFRGMSLLDIARLCLERAGIKTNGLDSRTIAKLALAASRAAQTSSTSDFPVLLENVMNKVLLNNYVAVQDTWRKFCFIGSVSDFRAHKRLRMGSFSTLDSIGENGELKNKPISDAESNSISAATKGNLINISRNMIINDDLQAFTRLTAMLGRAAARSIEVDVYALLTANPTMGDGVALFHASHGNLNTAAAMSAVEFDKLRVAMAKQVDKDSNDFLDLRPSVLLCGIGQGANARVINDALYDPDTANKLQKPNLAKGIFNNIVDTARVTGTEYYAFADPNEEPVIEVAFLNGVQTPYMEQEQAFEQLGINWRVYMDYGVGAVGWRGAVKNPGA